MHASETAARAATQARREPRFPSTFVISTIEESGFTAAGRRDFLQYRDLGTAGATGGEVGAVVTRTTGETVEAKTGWHYHVCDLQLIYIIKGWLELEFEETGVMRLEAGTCINIPPGLAHNEYQLSPDMEVIEVTMPSKIETVGVAAPTG